ncbi:MAG: hypothetical protein Q7R76_02255 [Candidatus Woesearchaeota archaeon]|nr:hypothetical protein [Candidatus Woesearchaeota archaeon]
MKDVLKKAILLGLGAGALTKEKAEKAVKQLKNSKLTPAEGKKFVFNLVKESQKECKHFEQVAERELKYVARLSGLTPKHIHAAHTALDRLERLLGAKKSGRKKKR